MSASSDVRVSEELTSLTAPQTLGLVGAELYGFINSCATNDQLQAVAALVWEHYGTNRLSDNEATYLGSCIDRRRGVSRRAAPVALAPLRGRVTSFFPASLSAPPIAKPRGAAGGCSADPVYCRRISGTYLAKASAQCFASLRARSSVRAGATGQSTRLPPWPASAGPWCRTPFAKPSRAVASLSSSAKDPGSKTCPTL